MDRDQPRAVPSAWANRAILQQAFVLTQGSLVGMAQSWLPPPRAVSRATPCTPTTCPCLLIKRLTRHFQIAVLSANLYFIIRARLASTFHCSIC